MSEENKDIEQGLEEVNKMAENIETIKATMEAKMESLEKSMANIDKAMIRSNDEEKEVGTNYGFLQAKHDIAKGKNAKAPYWDDKTTARFDEYVKMLGKKDYEGIQKEFGDNVQSVTNWIPTEFKSELVRLGFVNSMMLPKVTIVPMGRDKIELPKPSGDLAWGFVDAGGAMVEDNFTAGKLTLDCSKAYGMALANQEDLDDSAYPLAAYIAAQLGEDYAKFMDKVILYGDADGSTNKWDGKFDGWAEASGVGAVTGAADATPTFAELMTYANLVSLTDLDELSIDGAEFFFSPSGYNAIRALKDDQKMPLVPINAGYNYNLLGFPTNVSSRVINTPAVSTVVGFFGNPKYIYVGDRMDMSIATSEHYRFANDQVVFRAMSRFALAVGLPGSLKKLAFGAAS
jgi:HK97 family phage major capsid protein